MYMYRSIILSFLFLFATHASGAQVMRIRDTLLMGGHFGITIVADDSLTAEQYIDTVITEITRIENLISDWRPSTQVSAINRNAGVSPVKVDAELLELTAQAVKMSELTNGAFDISFAAMEKIWKFDGSIMEMPAPEVVAKAREKVGYRNILINKDSSTIFLKLPGMKIGFGALGEGYAADRCRDIMLAHGVKAGLINATGDICTWGERPDGKPWKIGIRHPFKSGQILDVLKVHGAVTTSGSYEKYTMIDGKRYSHIINPATGYPATGLTSVTVLGSSAETANACSTSMMVLGKEKGLALLKQFKGYSCIMVTDKGRIIKYGRQTYNLHRIL